MEFFKTSSCCCCINLRTAGIIIGFLSLAGCLIFPTFGWPWEFIWLAIYGAWLFGIFKNQLNWMLPALCYNILKLFIVGLSIIWVPIAGFLFADEIQKYINDIARKKHIQDVPTVTAVVTFLWVAVAITAALQYHISSVMYSLYESI